jgi:hypothetical protein
MVEGSDRLTDEWRVDGGKEALCAQTQCYHIINGRHDGPE